MIEARDPLPAASDEQAPEPLSARVAIVSPVRLVRDGLSAMLRDCPFVAAVHAFVLDDRGVAEAERIAPDVVLVDLGATEQAAVAHRLRSAIPKAKLVAFALAEVDEQVFACAAAGFVAYVPRDGDAGELHRTILDALRGRTRIAAALFSRLANRIEVQRESISMLTRRENEVLALARRGFSNKIIARDLAISPATVKNHMHSILHKLQVNGRSEAAAKTPTAHARPGMAT